MSSLQECNLIHFLSHCLSSSHAVDYIKNRMLKADFQELNFSSEWRLQPSQRYFLKLDHGAIFAFEAQPQAAQLTILGCHTDSPSLKLKAHGLIQEEGFWLAHVEPYGSPILSSWFYKDLGVCARVFTDGPNGPIEKQIVINEPVGILLSPSLHLDRDLNQKGFAPDKQKHLKILISSQTSHKHPLLMRLEAAAGGQILNFEIDFFVLEQARSFLLDSSLVASSRIDNLASCSACLEAMINQSDSTLLRMAIFANHEEIGSQTHSGASSTSYPYLVHKALEASGFSMHQRHALLAQGLFLSVDNAHGYHPVYQELYEPNHKPLLGQGPVIKYHPCGKYATDALSSSRLLWLAKKYHIPLQSFHIRADLACGSTIGPILSTALGIGGVDIGLAQLSMHASRELLHLKDYQHLVDLLSCSLCNVVQIHDGVL